MEKIFLFVILSIPIIIISWRTLFNVKSHGFYRFFSWECILWLFVSNYAYWFKNPFSIQQIFSWMFLFSSAYLVVAGMIIMKKMGRQEKNNRRKTLYKFEQTTELIDKGIFKYIRHPLYSSLILLTWGIYLKNPKLELIIFSVLSTLFLYLTSIFDEKECKIYFGAKYSDYMKRSKMFIPYIF